MAVAAVKVPLEAVSVTSPVCVRLSPLKVAVPPTAETDVVPVRPGAESDTVAVLTVAEPSTSKI